VGKERSDSARQLKRKKPERGFSPQSGSWFLPSPLNAMPSVNIKENKKAPFKAQKESFKPLKHSF
jgi:hypothetical protein